MFKGCCCCPGYRRAELEANAMAASWAMVNPDSVTVMIDQTGIIKKTTAAAIAQLHPGKFLGTQFGDLTVDPFNPDDLLEATTLRFSINSKTKLLKIETTLIPATKKSHFFVIELLPPITIEKKETSSDGKSGADAMQHITHNLGNSLQASMLELRAVIGAGKPLTSEQLSHINLSLDNRAIQIEMGLLTVGEFKKERTDASQLMSDLEKSITKWTLFRPKVSVVGLDAFSIPEGYKMRVCGYELVAIVELLTLRLLMNSPRGNITVSYHVRDGNITVSLNMLHSLTPVEGRLTPIRGAVVSPKTKMRLDREVYTREESKVEEGAVYCSSLDGQLSYTFDDTTLLSRLGANLEVNTAPRKTSLKFSMEFEPASSRSFPAPLASGAAGTATIETTEEKMIAKTPIHILVVEDERLNRRLLINMLKTFGEAVTWESCVLADEAFHLVKENPTKFDQILMDIVMPRGKNGDVVTRNLLKAYPHLYIIATTANNTTEDREKYAKIGFKKVIGKPYSAEEIQKVVRKRQKEIKGKLAPLPGTPSTD